MRSEVLADSEDRVEVRRDNVEEAVVVGGGDCGPPPRDKGKFKTMKSLTDDLKGLVKPPQTLWNQSYAGEVITDECHPANSSFAVGATGGLVTGLATGFFSSQRVPLPVRTPFPGSVFPKLQTFMRSSIISSSVVWRMSKRAALGAVLFSVLECDFQDIVRKQENKWKGSLVAGIVSGGVFGLRGGFPGMLMGMGVFSSLTGLWELYKQKERVNFSWG